MEDQPNYLEKNLRALAQQDAALAEDIRTAVPAPLEWATAKSGILTASLEIDGKHLALASKYDPQAEAAKLIANVDHAKTAAVVILGMGLGHHVTEAAKHLKNDAILIIFEPDLPVLRAVLERFDYAGWLGKRHAVLCGPNTDRATLLSKTEPFAGTLTQGTTLVAHPPTRRRHADSLNNFASLMTDITAFFRTNVATALVNATRTCFNVSCNLPHYVAGATVNELENAAAGYPAVCVGAGPSLAKNVDLLRDPAIRKRIIVITAQTTLKPLLDRGIRPDFVTALDYSEISSRFYEDLPPLPDVTLVVEPKGHPSILDAFPGPIRVTNSRFLNRMLGELSPKVSRMREGATVAHLSFYLAQFLGCDPIFFIGQDLGFSDGLYYCPGTAIHDVWAPELNVFNTVESMEWQRIIRHKGHIKRLEDIHGRPMYSDEQMITYLKQFERDFGEASQQLIDCTEGGLRKQGTEIMTLADAIEQYATRDVPALPQAELELDQAKLAAALDLIRSRLDEVQELRRLSKKTLPLLEEMIAKQNEPKKFNKLFDKVRQIQFQVHGVLGPTFSLVNELNVIGAFKRSRSDRAIAHTAKNEKEKQVGQLHRDVENIDWLIQACDEALDIFRQSEERIIKCMKTENIEVLAA